MRRFETVQRPETLLFLETGDGAATPEVFERMVTPPAGLAVMAAAESGVIRLLTSGGAEMRATGAPTGARRPGPRRADPHRQSPAARLPAGAARMILLAVIGSSVGESSLPLDRFGPSTDHLQLLAGRAPDEHRDILAIGPGESITERWNEFRMLRSGSPAR